MALNPQQQAFKEAYTNPSSGTFGDFLKSKEKAGYSRKEAWRDKPTNIVYFVLCPVTNRVKIGTTTHDPDSRLETLKTGASTGDKYQMLITMVDFEDGAEKNIHRIFDKYRVYREWFRYEGDLKQFLKTVIDDGLNQDMEGTDSLLLVYPGAREAAFA